ncbi:MAG: type IV pilus twitching motility protein PilT [Candidatus Xenobia bacterium]
MTTPRKAKRLSPRPSESDDGSSPGEEPGEHDELETSTADLSTPEGMRSRLIELEREVREAVNKARYAVDAARASEKKALQTVEDIDALQNSRNEIAEIVDANADVVDALQNEVNELKEKVASGIPSAGGGGGEAVEMLHQQFEEMSLSLQDVSERLDALAKDSGTTRVSLDDVIKNQQSVKHTLEEHQRLIGSIEDVKTEVAVRLEDFAQKSGESAVPAGLEERLKGIEQQVMDAVGELEKKAGGEMTASIQQLQAERDELNRKVAGLEERLKSLSGLEQLATRTDEAVARSNEMETRVKTAEEQVSSMASKIAEASRQVELNYDRMRMAVRLVDEISEKAGRVGSSAAAPAHAPEHGVEVHVEDEEVPESTDLGFELNELLEVMLKHNASDLHLKVGSPPTVRLDGELIPVGNQVLTERDCKRLIFTSMSKNQKRRLLSRRELDYAYSMPKARFRINAFMQKGTVSAAFRLLRTEMPTVEELGLPPVLKRLVSYNSGLLLVTGPAGSGKSTTLAALVDFINRQKRMHIITIEDPIEFVHKDNMSLVTQREVGTDAIDFKSALHQAVKQDPNVILISDLPDPETIMQAAVAAETGHLVLATVHTSTTVQAIDRLCDVFTGDQQRQFRMLLANTLRGVISQRLLNRADQEGRVVAAEVLIVNQPIQQLILDGNTAEVYPHVVAGTAEGMQTFTSALNRLYEAGLITKEEAVGATSDQPTGDYRASAEGGNYTPGPPQAEQDTLMNWL